LEEIELRGEEDKLPIHMLSRAAQDLHI